MRKRFQMLVCAAAFTAAAGLCTLPLTAFAADAAVLLPDESAPIVEVVLEPLTPAAEETEPAEPEEREPAAEPAEPETDLPEAPGIVTLPAEGIVVVPTAAEDTVDIDVSWGAMEFTYTAAWIWIPRSICPPAATAAIFRWAFTTRPATKKPPWTSYRRPDHPRFLTPLFFKVFLPAGTAVREFCIHRISARRNFL